MSDEFKVLNEREHVLARPAMYLGSTSLETAYDYVEGAYSKLTVVPGLIKIINEIIDNSTDEFIRTNGKYANKIDVTIGTPLEPNRITIADNGRGIPVVKAGDSYQPVVAWSQARAGSNFSDDSNRITMGMNGVGSFITNVFSKSFSGHTCDGTYSLSYESKNNASKDSFDIKAGRRKGTSVSFVPDLERLGGIEDITDDHITVIRNRLSNLAICFPGLVFTLNGETIKFKNIKEVATTYSENSLSYDFGGVKMFIAESGDDQEFRLISYVNGLHIKNGGSHVDYMVGGIVDALRPMIKRKHKIEVMPNQIKQHLMLGVFVVGFKDLKFDSQTKERITNTKSEIESHMSGSVDFTKIARQILSNEAIITPIIEAILAKKEFADRMALAKKQKAAKKAKVAKHIAATSKNFEEKTLFITEGNSAMNNLIAVRDPKTVGGYPLKGKVMNTRGMKGADIVKNKELFELMAVLGLHLGDPNPNLNYGRIGIMADADVDGYAISCLLINFFSNWPVLFEEGRVFLVKTPKYIARKGKNVLSFYSTEEYRKANTRGYDVDYIKGLGTLPREAYKDVINNPKLVRVDYDNEIQESEKKLDMAFGDNAALRKEWLLS